MQTRREQHADKTYVVLNRCPPGHGDVYPSLLGSGFLDRLLSKGIKYLFVSNSDNLGATLDVDLLAYFAKTDKAFLMEVCRQHAHPSMQCSSFDILSNSLFAANFMTLFGGWQG